MGLRRPFPSLLKLIREVRKLFRGVRFLFADPLCLLEYLQNQILDVLKLIQGVQNRFEEVLK